MSLVFHAPLLGTPQFKDTVQNSFVSSSGTAEIVSTQYFGPRLLLSGSGTSYLKYSPDLHKTSRITIAFWYCPQSYADTNAAWKDVIRLHTTSYDGTASADFRLEKWGDGNTYHSWHNNGLATSDGGVACGDIRTDYWYHIILSVDTKTGYWKSWLYDYETGEVTYTTNNQIVKPCYFDNDIYIIKEDNISNAHYSDVRIYDDFISDKEISELRKRPLLHYSFSSPDSGNKAMQSIYNFKDNSGNDLHPVINNAYIDTTSRIGVSCADFVASDKNYISIPRDAMPERRLTFNVWAYMDDWSQINSNENGCIVSCTESGGWSFEYGGREGFENTYNNFIWSLEDNDYILIRGKNPAELSHGWHMFTLTFDGSYARQYVDGELTGQSNLFTGAPEGRIKYNSSNAIFLGAEASSNTTTPTDYGWFNGKMNDVKIYATALSEDDIKNEFNTRAYLTNKNELLVSSINESQKVGIDKKGNYSSPNIIENQYIYTEDGAKFLKIFLHDIRNSTELFPADPHEVATSYITDSINRFSRLKDIPQFISTEGKYEFLLRYPECSEILYNRWRQTANPLTTLSFERQTAESMGYEPVEIAWSSAWKYGMGFRKANTPDIYYGPESYLDCQVGDPNWYGGIGQNTLWNGGFPAPDGNAYKCVELYIRVDNTNYNNPASIRKEELIPSKLKLPNLIKEYIYLELHSEATAENGCYFDTGYIPNADTEIEIKFKISSMENGIFVFGAGGSAHDDAAFELYNWDGNWEFNYGTDGGATRVPATTDDCIFTFKDKVAKFSNSEITSIRTVTTLPTKSLYLFALNRTGGAVYGSSSRIYYCKIWEKGKLIKHYIPAHWEYTYRLGTATYASSYDSGFYDVINNIYSSAKYINRIQKENGGLLNPFTGASASYATNYKKWEDGYQPVEYIESTGTQYINTGIGYQNGTSFTYELKVQFPDTATTIGSGHHRATISNTNGLLKVGYAQTNFNARDWNTAKIAWSAGNVSDTIQQSSYVNGDLIAINTTEPYDTNPYLLFACCSWNDSTGVPPYSYDSVRISSSKFYRDNTLVRHFVACYRKSDGAIGLYDRVHQRFYENDGTGTFIKGPDIANEHITTFMDEFKEI